MIHIHKWKLINKKEKYNKYGGYTEIQSYVCNKCGLIKIKNKWRKEPK